MADFLRELEKQRQLEEEAKQRKNERAQKEEYARQQVRARYDAAYERNKLTIEEIKKRITDYVAQANQIGGRHIQIRESHCGLVVSDSTEIDMYNKSRKIDIDPVGEDFRIIVTKQGHAIGRDRANISIKTFKVSINRVSDRHISSWIKWVATGQGSIVPILGRVW